MSPLFIFALACIAQNALCQGVSIGNGCGCGNNAGNVAAANGPGVGLNGLSLGGVPISGVSPVGYGDVAVVGELPIGGSTAIIGNVPVIGYVTFEGTVPAGGSVSVAGNCGCNNGAVY